ncbi:MAG: peptide/nickel transport system substrate-binding protein [Gaiellales bacterium]|jgi:peptide/nickel transport system substrate-binding protein|nr:peptide/nickel transport system substrate-binding protein [Gaiellales bacterium]
MEQHPFEETSEGRGGSLSRRDLLAATGGVVLAGSLAGNAASALAAGTAAKPKRGGTFRLGVTGGGAKDIIDGQSITTKPDQARLTSGWETLLTYDRNYKLGTDGLAEEATQDNAKQWTIRVKDGIEFNNGKTLSADDVIYSLRRIANPKNKLFGSAGLGNVDVAGLKKMDKRTVRMKLKTSDSTIGEQLGQYYNGIVPVGYSRTNKLKWVGTGPFITQSFSPGRQSVHKRNPNYWRTGQPYFDTVQVIDFADPTAQVNALFSGSIDAMTDIPFAQLATAKSHGNIKILESPGGGWLPLCMAVDMAPFDDVNVRKAMRLIVDRPAMLAQVLSGHGRVANDLYAPFDADFDKALPQRHQDIEQAKALLKAAGKEGLTVDLHTTDGAAGMVDSANVFASQAKAAGVTINVKNDPNYYGDQYLKLPFSVDFWGTRTYLAQAALGSIQGGAYNECHWGLTGSKYLSLYKQAVAAPTPAKRHELVIEMQKLEYNTGGYIIPFFNNLIDAYSAKVTGFVPSKGTLNLDAFGHGYRTIWFA